MDSTSSSAKGAQAAPSRFAVRLKGGTGQVDLPLLRGCEEDGRLHLQKGVVTQDGQYEVALLFPKGCQIAARRFRVEVNDEAFDLYREEGALLQTIVGSEVCEGFQLKSEDRGTRLRLFALAYGYVRLRVAFLDERGAEVDVFRTKDITCECSQEVNARDIEQMLAVLLGDPSKDVALRWLLSDGGRGARGRYSVIEGGFKRGAERSVDTYLVATENALDAIEAAIPSLKAHAASRIVPSEKVIPAREARRFGAREARWLARNPQALRPAVPGERALACGGGRYAPESLSAAQAKRSFDVYENQVVLAFLSLAICQLTDFADRVSCDSRLFSPLDAAADDEGSSRSFSGIALRILRGNRLVRAERAKRLRGRALRAKKLLSSVLPHVTSIDITQAPLRRTPTFREVHAYSKIFSAVDRFLSFGESPYFSDGLAIEVVRADRLYEIYVLYCLLSALEKCGFAPKEGERAVYAGAYDPTPKYPANPSPVANVFALERGDVAVRMWYEPAIYPDARELNGCSLHKTRGGTNPVTPDFVIKVNDGAGSSAFVLDAKYSRADSLTRVYAGESESRWEACVGKYLKGVVDGETGRLPCGLWLLSGLRGERDCFVGLDTLPWLTQERRTFESGIMPVRPGVDVSDLLVHMGIIASEGGRRQGGPTAADAGV
ncbi:MULTISPECIES: hypothetical protein [unclassified Adlercreutzia]|uniref:hypothetical protein n=1 Tax=unclassified Adlercreutzia TaxID=2636013 RepID=UPI0013ECA6C1|nr:MULTISPECIES: hypothetical protein [unclassified Adlercreutzia]